MPLLMYFNKGIFVVVTIIKYFTKSRIMTGYPINLTELQAYANMDELRRKYHSIQEIPNGVPVMVNTAKDSHSTDWKRGVLGRCKFNVYGTQINEYWVDIEGEAQHWFVEAKVCVDRTFCCLITDKPHNLEFIGNAFTQSKLYEIYRTHIKELGVEPEDQYIAGFSKKPEGLELLLLEDSRGIRYGDATLYIYKQSSCRLTTSGHEWQGVFKINSINPDILTSSCTVFNSTYEGMREELDEQANWLIKKGWIVKRGVSKT